MSKIFVTSDLHLGHTNIIKFQPETRPFRDVTHMDESMILDWNSNVDPEDIVYIIGDVAFGHVEKATATVRRLNGIKILIEGNHDRKHLTHESFRSCFAEVHKYLEIEHNGTLVCMFHYPILSWNRSHHGSVHLHGHAHGHKSGLEHLRVRDVGYDATGNIVSDLTTMVNDALKGEMKHHHT